ncbi:hypothetical protein D3C71_1297370 [compost metagenome]
MRSTRALCSVGGPCSRHKADCCHSLIRLSPNLCHLWRAPHEPQATAFVVRHPLCFGGRCMGPCRGARGYVPYQAHHAGDSVPARWRHRRAGPPHWQEAGRQAGPERGDRQPRRGGHHHRRGLCGQGRAGRLHAADELGHHLHREPRRARQAAVRPGQEFRAHWHRRAYQPDPAGQQGCAGQRREAVCGHGEGRARQIFLWLVWRGHYVAVCGRDVLPRGGPQDPACALQGQLPRHGGLDGRTDSVHRRYRVGRAAPAQRRQDQGHCRDGGQALGPAAQGAHAGRKWLPRRGDGHLAGHGGPTRLAARCQGAAGADAGAGGGRPRNPRQTDRRGV